ncbi:DUF7341 domain-containing protein [Georgenia thermotolerans]|uniref:DUF7341 domain-containing protein n=1 Tax=Georgenia thermotolerans TaxID=527326 RepID=UPI0012641B3E|nr:hypothetical protein [Georgenia thermotolerans]
MTEPTERAYKPDHVYRAAILDRVNRLTRPITTREKYDTEDGTRTHVTRHPSLLGQLASAVTGTTGPSTAGGKGFESKPAARLDALDALTRIEQEARWWVAALYGPRRATAAANLQWLAGHATTMPTHDLADLDHDTRSWVAAATTISGIDQPAWRPYIPCPNCDEKGTLRIRTDPVYATCVACGEGWDRSTVGAIADHLDIVTQSHEIPTVPASHEMLTGGSGRGLVASDEYDLPGAA